MENRYSSASEILTYSTSNESYHGSDDRKESLSVDSPRSSADADRNNANLILDLRNVPSISVIKSDDEKSEQLSEVVEEPEESFVNETQNREGQDCTDSSLRNRICSLQGVIVSLREELQNELSLWKKERQEFEHLREMSDKRALEEATAAARAAAVAYAAESSLSLALGDCILDTNSEQTLSELTILEYEKKLARYQDALALAQAEKRYNVRRQHVANTYRQKLIEVERLCYEELENIRQNANSLQPLKQIASQWCVGDGNHGDSTQEIFSYATLCQSTREPRNNSDDSFSNVDCNIQKVETEVNMGPEILVAKFDSDNTSLHGNAVWGDVENSHSQVFLGNNVSSMNWYTSARSSC